MSSHTYNPTSTLMKTVLKGATASAAKTNSSNIKGPTPRAQARGSENKPPQKSSATEAKSKTSTTDSKSQSKRKCDQGKARAGDDPRAPEATKPPRAPKDGLFYRNASRGPLRVIQPNAEQISQPGEEERLALLLAEDDRKLEQREEELERKEAEGQTACDLSEEDISNAVYDANPTDDEDDKPPAPKRQKRPTKTLHKLYSAQVANRAYSPSDEESEYDSSSGTEEDG